MNQQKFRRVGAVSVTAALALVVLAACGNEGESVLDEVTRVPVVSEAAEQATREAAEAPPEPEGEETEVAASPEPGGEPPASAQTVEVVSVDIAFEPSEVTIPANTDVTFVLPNVGAAPHNFAIDALGIDVDQAPGATEEIVINAPAGEYEYYCNVPGHKEAGMVGTLIVTEDAAAAPAVAGDAADATPGQEAATPAAEMVVETGVASPAAIVGTIAADETPATPAATIAAALGEASPAPAPSTQAEATPAAASQVPASPAADAGQPAAAAETVEVVSVDIAFEPTALTIPANTDVTFILPNNGVAPHNFIIDELGISVEQAPGATEEVVINAPAGEYEYYCSIPGHKEAGMVGTLTVE